MTQHEFAPLYTDEQRDMLASRTLHDAELLQSGAEYTALGGLAITSEQYDQLHDNEAMRHFASTPEAELIDDHASALSEIRREIGFQHLQFAGDLRQNPPVFDIGHANEFLRQERVPVDLLSVVDSPTANAAVESLDNARQALRDLTVAMAGREDLRFDSQVTVRRSPAAGERIGLLENNWTIDNIHANGEVVVLSADGNHAKSLTLDHLLALNPPQTDN